MTLGAQLNSGPLTFYQDVTTEGYELIEGELNDERSLYLVESAPLNSQQPMRQYEPLKIVDLHRKFARVGQDPAGIQQFDTKYGLLHMPAYQPDPFWGDGMWYVEVAGLPSERQRREYPQWGEIPLLHVESAHTSGSVQSYPYLQAAPRLNAEPYHFWAEEIVTMRLAIDIWDGVREGKAAALKEYFHWGLSPHPRLYHPPIAAVDPNVQNPVAYIDDPRILTQWEFGDVVSPARRFVYQVISNKLQEGVVLALSTERKGEVVVMPKRLLAALYILFAQEVSGRSRQPRTCKGCQRFFVPNHGNQYYCENACSDRHWWHESNSAKSPNRRKRNLRQDKAVKKR